MLSAVFIELQQVHLIPFFPFNFNKSTFRLLTRCLSPDVLNVLGKVVRDNLCGYNHSHYTGIYAREREM